MKTAIRPSLETRVQKAIARNPHLHQHQLDLTTENGQVLLEGRVQSFFEKQMAQEAIKHIEGVDCIVNQLEVTWC